MKNVTILLVALTYLFQAQAFASSRTKRKFGVKAGYSTCFGGNFFGGIGWNFGENFRASLDYTHFILQPKYNQPELGLTWLITKTDLAPFVGVSSFLLIKGGLDYTSEAGINMGIGLQTGRCTGPFVYLGKYF